MPLSTKASKANSWSQKSVETVRIPAFSERSFSPAGVDSDRDEPGLRPVKETSPTVTRAWFSDRVKPSLAKTPAAPDRPVSPKSSLKPPRIDSDHDESEPCSPKIPQYIPSKTPITPIRSTSPRGSLTIPRVGSDHDEPEPCSAKKKQFDSKKLPWYEADRAALQTCRPSVRRTHELLELYSENISQVKAEFLRSLSAPTRIPLSEIENAILGLPLQLDNLFAARYPSYTKTINNATDWIATWTQAKMVYKFLFPHRFDEVSAYGDHIAGLFATFNPSTHHKILLYDVKIRSLVGPGLQLLLTDFDHQEFRDIYSATFGNCGFEPPSSSSPKLPKESSPSVSTLVDAQTCPSFADNVAIGYAKFKSNFN